jgi:hypothetical protein
MGSHACMQSTGDRGRLSGSVTTENRERDPGSGNKGPQRSPRNDRLGILLWGGAMTGPDEIRILLRSIALGTQFFSEMSDDDRSTFDRQEWREGVNLNCFHGENPDLVMNRIEVLIKRHRNASPRGALK